MICIAPCHRSIAPNVEYSPPIVRTLASHGVLWGVILREVFGTAVGWSWPLIKCERVHIFAAYRNAQCIPSDLASAALFSASS